MTNKHIALVFVYVSWALFFGALVMGSALLIFYAVICICLSFVVYNNVDKTPPSGRGRH